MAVNRDMESTAAEVGAVGDGGDVTDGVGEGIVGDELQPATNDEPTRMATAVQRKRIGRPFRQVKSTLQSVKLAGTGTTFNGDSRWLVMVASLVVYGLSGLLKWLRRRTKTLFRSQSADSSASATSFQSTEDDVHGKQ